MGVGLGKSEREHVSGFLFTNKVEKGTNKDKRGEEKCWA
jgi:hypothetical protein